MRKCGNQKFENIECFREHGLNINAVFAVAVDHIDAFFIAVVVLFVSGFKRTFAFLL